MATYKNSDSGLNSSPVVLYRVAVIPLVRVTIANYLFHMFEVHFQSFSFKDSKIDRLIAF